MKEIDFRTHLLPLKDKLYRLALRITQNHPEAQDVVQETFIRAWERRSELAKVESVEAYMLKVCRNLAIDRSEKCENRNIPLSQTDADAPAADASAQERLEHDERIRSVRKALERLPLRQRMAIQLRDIEGMSYHDAALAMDITEDVLRVTLHRARTALRQALEKEFNYGL